MAYETVNDAIVVVARGMSLVNAAGMTPYSQDAIVDLLQKAHSFIIKEQEWQETKIVHTRTLDGVTGKFTQGITEVKDWKKVIRVYHESSMKPLPLVTNYSNPLISTTLIGYRGLTRPEDAGPNYLLLQFFPLILTGQVLLHSKLTYDFSSSLTQVIPIDFWLHVHRALWEYSTTDGTNSLEVDKHKNNYNECLAQVKDAENSRPISQDPYAAMRGSCVDSSDPYG